MSSALSQQVSDILANQGVQHYGYSSLQPALTLEFYRNWIAQGFHGNMEYLSRHLLQKEDPKLLLDKAQSAIVVGWDYLPHPSPTKFSSTSLRVAFYARGEDYHFWLKEKLNKVLEVLEKNFPESKFLAATDSSPVLERDLAYRAGLGWFGKNTCLIHQRRGSFFLLGEILTTLPLSPLVPLHPDRCGTCTRCIEACPTQAFVAPRQLDARKCISYLTIEAKTLPPAELRAKIGDNFFGCDICQAVCPWNEKVFGAEIHTEQGRLREGPTSQDEEILCEELRYILEASNRDLEKHFANSPLVRARGFGLKRNALIVAGNRRLHELRDAIAALLTDSRLGELASWALKQME